MKVNAAFVLFFLFVGWWSIQEIEVTLIVDPNPSPYISDWETDPTLASLTIQSFDQQPLELSLEAELTENSMGLIGQAQSQPLFLEPGDMTQINAAELLVNESVQYNPDLEEQIISTGRIPEGDYQICIHVFEEPEHLIIQTVCQPFFIQQILPPEIIYPIDVDISFDQFTICQWTPVESSQPEPVQYAIKMAQVFENQTPEEALIQNSLILEDMTSDITFPVDWLLLDLDPSHPAVLIAWQVQSFDLTGIPIGDNEGLSEVASFNLVNQQSSNSITILSPGYTCVGNVGTGHVETDILLDVEVTGQFDNLYLVITSNTCGRFTPAQSTDDHTTTSGEQQVNTAGEDLNLPDEVLEALQELFSETVEIQYTRRVETEDPGLSTTRTYTYEVPVSQTVKPGEAYTTYVCGTELVRSHEVIVSEPTCDRYSPESPITGETVEDEPCEPPPEEVPANCNIQVEEKMEPLMDGGLLDEFTGKRTINRDDFIPLGAEARDYDTFRFDCIPGEGLSGRQRSWFELGLSRSC